MPDLAQKEGGIEAKVFGHGGRCKKKFGKADRKSVFPAMQAQILTPQFSALEIREIAFAIDTFP